jgi:hypothetical protein
MELIGDITKQILLQLQRDIRTLPPPFLTHLIVDGHSVPIHYRRSHRAQRYRLWIDPFARVQAVIPRNGSPAKAHAFFIRQENWVIEQWRNRRAWVEEQEQARNRQFILFRGKETKIVTEETDSKNFLCLSDERFIFHSKSYPSLQTLARSLLQTAAKKELADRTMELAAQYQFQVHRVSVRNQRSRWGSCSSRGTISLNWKLLQVPLHVRDYIILHELAHRRQMNHSPRYWQLVASICPFWKEAEQWLRQHDYLLLEE